MTRQIIHTLSGCASHAPSRHASSSEEALCSRQVLVDVRTALDEAVAQNTPMGLMAKAVLDDGKILPDSLQVP